MNILLTVLNPLLIIVTKGNLFNNQGRFYDLSFIPALWLCDVSKPVIKYIDCDVSEAKHAPFLVLANKLFIVL